MPEQSLPGIDWSEYDEDDPGFTQPFRYWNVTRESMTILNDSGELIECFFGKNKAENRARFSAIAAMTQ